MRRRKLVAIGPPFNVSMWCEDDVPVTCTGPDGGKRVYNLRPNPRGLELIGQQNKEIVTEGDFKPIQS